MWKGADKDLRKAENSEVLLFRLATEAVGNLIKAGKRGYGHRGLSEARREGGCQCLFGNELSSISLLRRGGAARNLAHSKC